MRKRIKKILAVFLVAVMLFGALTAAPFAASAAETSQSVGASSGTTGDCTWTLDDNGTLIISGNGKMGNYDVYSSLPPWGKYIKCVIIENNVTSIGERAFYDCDNLTNITIPDSVTSINTLAFLNCTSLASITIPDSVTSIGYAAFEYCTSLASITIPDSVTSIGYHLFEGCASLASITVNPNNKKYDSRNNCNAIIITDTNTLIEGCKTTVIPNTVTSIGDWAFEGRTSLASITIPDSVTHLGLGAFAYSGSLTSVTIPDSVTSFSDCVFYGCTSLESVIIPDTVTFITDSMFGGCTSLENITIGSSVKLIESFAFVNCTSLASITIPDSVTRIKAYAFYHCQQLSDVYYSGSEEDWKKIQIESNGNDCLTSSNMHYNYTYVKDEVYKDNSILTLLKNAQKSGKSILSDYDAGDTAKAITFDVLTNLFNLAAEQLTVDFGGDTPEEKALDEVTQNIMKDYFGYNDSIEEQKLNSINEKWNCFNTAVKAVKKLRTQKKEAEAKKLAKNTIKQITKKGNSFGDKVINGFRKVSPYIDGAFTYYEIAMTAAMLQEFDKATVESLLNTFPKNTTAYTGLQRLYHDMTIGSEQYIVEKFTQEAIISALSEFLEEVTFQGNEGLKEAYSSASGILSLAYELSGGVTMKDISRARSAEAIAANALSLMISNSDSAKREMLFNFCLSSIKVELENCIKVCKSSSASLKSSAQYYQGKVNKLTYEKYIKNCVNEYTNPQGVSFENPDLEKYKISAKNSTNNKASSPVGANEDESITHENELIIPSSTADYLVTSISENGFANLESITTIYVPESIEEIGDSAFYHCVDTQSITLGNNVTLIGEKAFMDCSNLSSINLNANLKTIKGSAFENCSKLKSAVLGKELSELGDKVFANCESLSIVFVFNPTLVIPDAVFENCGNLTIYGYSGSTAEEYANLHNIQFENIGDSAAEIKVNYNGEPTVELYGSVNADNISLDIIYSDGKTETATDGFAVACDTSSVGKKNAVLIYGSAYTTFEIDVVSSVPTEISFDNQNYNMVIGDRIVPNVTLSPESTGYQVVLTSSDESVVSIEGDSIVAVGEGNAEITAAAVEGTLNTKCSVTVGNSQAIDCSDGLFEPVFFIAPESKNYRFTINTNDAKITLMDHDGNIVKDVENNNGFVSFVEKLQQDEVYLLYAISTNNSELIINTTLDSENPDDWKKRWAYTVLEDNTLEIEYIAKNTSTPDSTTINEQVIEIPREIDGKQVSAIADYAFEDCSTAKIILIPNSVNNIGRAAFRNCSNLESVFIPDSVTNIESYAFYKCTKLKSITLPQGISNISFGEFSGCKELTEIELPQNIERIEGYAFDGCKNLTEIILPDNITSISQFAFFDCKFRNIRVPKTVNSIGTLAIGYMDIGIDGVINDNNKIENFTIYGYQGTASETYANRQGFTFVALDNEKKIGDTDDDGRISIGDVTAIQRHLADLGAFSGEQLAVADVNGDGKVDINDATHLQRYLADFDVQLG